MKVTHGTPVEKKTKTAIPAITPKAPETPAAASGTEISEEARVYQKTTELVNAAPDVRKEKVAALKKALASGTYAPDATKIADALVDEHVATDFGKNNL